MLKNTDCCFVFDSFHLLQETKEKNLTLHLGGSKFGDGFGTFGDGVFGQFSWQDKADRGLDFTTGDGGFAVVGDQFTGFGGNLSKDVVDERVHDGHALLGNAGIGVDLLKDLVNVGAVALGALLLATGGGLLGGLGGLLGALGWCLSHGCSGDECNRTGRVVRAGRGRRAEHSMPERVGGA